jgi:hypothetical protein
MVKNMKKEIITRLIMGPIIKESGRIIVFKDMNKSKII